MREREKTYINGKMDVGRDVTNQDILSQEKQNTVQFTVIHITK